jgi:hypothetical protein
VKGGKRVIRVNRTEKGKKSIKAHGSPLVLAYTYAGGGEEEVSTLKKIASWWSRVGKTHLARTLAELADDLQMGIAMGAVAPGDTVYRTIV